jgi:hypothetical protein
MGTFSELFAEELEAHDDPPLLIFTADETSLILVQNRFKIYLSFRGGRQVVVIMAPAETVSLMTFFCVGDCYCNQQYTFSDFHTQEF